MKNVTKWRANSLSKMDVSTCRDLHALLWRYPTLLGITRNHVGPREVTRVGEQRKCQWCKHCRYAAENYILRQVSHIVRIVCIMLIGFQRSVRHLTCVLISVRNISVNFFTPTSLIGVVFQQKRRIDQWSIC